jgi:phosphopantetheine adenylyltransferase
MKNRIRCVSISDEFGPPGQMGNDFDALVLSHETLFTGKKLNKHRESLGMRPLKLLCTQRTEPHSMSSTALRRIRIPKSTLET